MRGITNLSSGKMGFAIARAAQEAGADVTLVAGPVQLPTPRHVRRIDVASAQQMHDTVLPLAARATRVRRHRRGGRLAAGQLRAAQDQEGRQRPRAGDRMAENPDILAAVARLPQRPYCVGFAAETNDLAHQCARKAASARTCR